MTDQPEPELEPLESLESLESIDYLLAQVCRLHRARAEVLLESIGLFRGQPPLLMKLHEAEGLTPGELAARLGVAPATMTKMIQRLARVGFVERGRDAVDQRVVRIYLTAAGRAVHSTMMAKLETLEAETFADFDAAELGMARSVLERLRANLRRALNLQQA